MDCEHPGARPDLKVLALPDERLRCVAADVSRFDQRLRDQARAMIATMRARNGAGLAAPQVALSQRMFVIEPDPQLGYAQVICNPRIIGSSEETDTESEGCLSIPGLFVPVCRPVAITLEAQDIHGSRHRFGVSGFSARVIQHETDHLDGVLMIDRLSAEHRTRLDSAIAQFAQS